MNIATKKRWSASRICVSSFRRGHANLLCIDPILVYVLPWQAQDHWSARGICTPRVPASSHQGDRELGTCKNLARKPNAKGGVAFAFKKTRGGRKGKENKKSQRGRLGVCCRKLRTFTDFSGAAVKYLSSKWDGTDFRTMRSNAETCVNSRLEDL